MATKSTKRGKSLSRMFVCPAGIVNDADRLIVNRIRDTSEYKANRSRLIQSLLKIAVASADELNCGEIIDTASFERQLRMAIGKASKGK
jgi:hypothetical protein